MPDWRQIVQSRLGRLKLEPATERDVVAELADHMAEHGAAALQKGRTEPEALIAVLEEVPDWDALNQEISAARREEDSMREHTRTIVVPGMTLLIGTGIFLMFVIRLIPPTVWVAPNARWTVPAIWLGAYCLLGALGAYWSRRVGGDLRARFLSGVFPVALHAAIFICVLVATLVGTPPPGIREALLSESLKIIVGFVFIPGVALAIGTLPFLRDGSERAPQLAQSSR